MSIPKEWTQFSPRPKELTNGDQWNVFLSYRSVNRSWVLNLYDVLRERGHKIFLDQCVLRAGDRLTGSLEDSLRMSQAGVLVWSDASRDSDWVREEYETMLQLTREKKAFQFVPVKLDSAPLPQFAKNRIFLDFSDYPDGPNGGELLRLLHAVVGKPLSDETARFANEQDEAARQATAKIKAAIKIGNHDRLKELFSEDGLPWKSSASLGCKAAEGLTKLGKHEEAIHMLEELEKQFPRAIRPRQLHALALARRDGERDLQRAQEIVGELYEGGERDPETLGIFARTWMDRYSKSGDVNHLKQSRDLYVEAFETAQDDYYTGINAAAKSVLIGTDEDLNRAVTYAQQVQQIVGAEPRHGDYWMTATIAEVLLIQKEYEKAAQMYEAAVGMARTEIGSHTSTWKQACRLMEKLMPPHDTYVLLRKTFRHLPDCREA